MTSTRLPAGGLIRRDRPLTVTIDGTVVDALDGDTAASAALASGITRVGDSIYRRRPRGILTASVAEPNAFVRLAGEHHESMLPATTLELADGDRLTWEDGIGELAQSVDAAESDHMHVHTDVAVIGAGPAGLAAAVEAARSGVRVTLFEQDTLLGGSLLATPEAEVEGMPATAWIDQARQVLEQAGARVLTRTGVFGSHDNNYLVALEKRPEREQPVGRARQRVWHVTAGRVVLATGALQRTLVFAGNDLPGVMLASAVATYVGRYAVLAGQEVCVATIDDSAYPLCAQLVAAGARVTVIDPRPEAGMPVPEGVERLGGHLVVRALGEDQITGVRVRSVTGAELRELDCDLLAVSGGWAPAASLHSQRQGSLRWCEELAAFVPEPGVHGQQLAGSVLGTPDLAGVLIEGRAAGAGTDNGRTLGDRIAATGTVHPLWLVREDDQVDPGALDEHFVDLQRDATVADIARAVGAGMRSVEHVKRYTSISTGLDQGKIGGDLTIGLLTELLDEEDMAAMPAGQPGQWTGDGAEDGGIAQGGRATTAEDGEAGAVPRRPSPGAIGTTTFRAPYTPVAFGALAGRHRGQLYDPIRRTPSHHLAAEQGARWEDVGQWKRAWFFPRDGEDMEAAVARECRAAREGVACMDASTLGKIEVTGPDAGEFLGRLYTNAFKKLAVGKQRYGMLCTADGMVLDDGVVFRFAEDTYMATTTTGGAARVLEWMEEWHQTEWPELDLTLTSVTEQTATIAVVGPGSRAVMERLAPDLDVSNEGFGFMENRETVLASGIAAQVARVTFSGELAFEISAPTWYGEALWEDVLAAGAEDGITPYGTETMHVLRAEKAYPIVGQDTDGTVTPQDLGMGWLISDRKDCVGKRSWAREGHVEEGRKQLVALLPEDRSLHLPEGAQVVELADAPEQELTGPASTLVPMIGHVTSSYRSQAIGRTFALALVRDGRSRIGSRLMASFQGRFVPVEVAESVVYDKEGAKRDG